MKKFTLLATTLLLTLGLTAAPVVKGISRPEKDKKELIKKAKAEHRAHKVVKDEEEDPFAPEPAEATTIDLVVTEAMFEEDYNGEGFELTLYANGGVLDLLLITSATEIPEGEFSFKAHEGVADESYVAASEGHYILDYSDLGLGLIEGDEPSYLLTDDENYYYLQSGTLNIVKDGSAMHITLDAISAHGSNIKASYSGQVLPAAFAVEPQEISEFDRTATAMNTVDYTKNYGDVYVQLTGEDFALLLDIITPDYPDGIVGKYEIKPAQAIEESEEAPETSPDQKEAEVYALASSGYSYSYESAYPSYFAVEQAGEVNYYFLQSGTVEISKDGDNYKVEVNGVSYFGSQIKVTYEGLTDQLNFDYEPDEATSINATDLTGEVSNSDGIFVIEAMTEDYLQMAVIELVSNAEELPVGEFVVAADSAQNTIIASPGGDASYDYGTRYFTTDGYYIVDTWYVVSGKVTITKEGEVYTVVLDGKSAKGSDIKLTITIGSPESAVENVFEDRSKTIKTFDGEKVVIINNGVKYNVLGVEIR